MKKAQAICGKTIKTIKADDDKLVIEFEDGPSLTLQLIQSCCESLYFVLDDDVEYYHGAELRDVKLARFHEFEEGDEIAFMDVHTSKGVLSICAHNEHNGYYGGFSATAFVGAKAVDHVLWASEDEP